MKFLAIICLMIFSDVVYSQKAFQHKDAQHFGIRTTELDSIYKSAIHSDSTLAVFSNQQSVINAYYGLLTDLGKFLSLKNYVWAQPTSGFNRIYFDADGSIDYFVYSFRGNQLSEEQIALFDKLLNEFIQMYIFPLSASEKFAQCSSVTYEPKKEE